MFTFKRVNLNMRCVVCWITHRFFFKQIFCSVVLWAIFDIQFYFSQSHMMHAEKLTTISSSSLDFLEQLKKHKGEVVSIEKGEVKDKVKIFYPSANVSADLPSIFTTVYGKLSFFEGYELIDLEFDQDLL